MAKSKASADSAETKETKAKAPATPLPTLADLIEKVEEVESSDNVTTFKMVAWPFSRKIVTATCQHLGVYMSSKRLNKQDEEFEIAATPECEKVFKDAVKMVNKMARNDAEYTKLESLSKARNQVVNDLCSELGVTGEVEKPKDEKSSEGEATTSDGEEAL